MATESGRFVGLRFYSSSPRDWKGSDEPPPCDPFLPVVVVVVCQFSIKANQVQGPTRVIKCLRHK